MADSGVTDGTTVLNSSLWESMIRKQVVAQLATGSLPAAATEGRLFADTTVDALKVDTGSVLRLFGHWTSATFTPTISASTTPPTGWPTSGRYWQCGALVYAEAIFTYGAGTAAVGNLRFGLPVTARAAGFCLGNVSANDTGAPYFRHPSLAATTYVEAYTEAGVAMTGASPFTPAASDFYRYSVLYLAA